MNNLGQDEERSLHYRQNGLTDGWDQLVHDKPMIILCLTQFIDDMINIIDKSKIQIYSFIGIKRKVWFD